MSETIIAKRYAQAIFELGNELGQIEKFTEQFLVIQTVFNENKELYQFLTYPNIAFEQKKNFIYTVFKDMEKEVVHTIALLVERHRTKIIPLMVDVFLELVHDQAGIATALIYSAKSLSKEQEATLKGNFEKRLNKRKLEVKNIVDPAIIGGVKVRIGNRIYDGSIQNKLERLAKSMKH